MKKKSFINGLIDWIDRAARFIPSPFKIFLWLLVIVCVVAASVNLFGGSLIDPISGEILIVRNPISKEGLQWFLSSFVTNFTGYLAFGPVLIMLVAVGICEESGFIGALLTKSTSSVPKKLIPLMICLIGVLSNAAGSSSIIIMTPIAGFLYLAIGKNPILGMITCYMANTSGMTANFILSDLDVITTQVTNAALVASGSNMQLDVTSNWYFFSASAVVITLTCYFISEGVLAKSFSPLSQEHVEVILATKSGKIGVTEKQTTALKYSGLAMLGFGVLVVVGVATGLLKGADGSISPLLNGLVVIVFVAFILLAVVYGKAAGTVNSLKDIEMMAQRSVSKMSSYIVLMILIGNFVALLDWTRLTKAVAIVAGEELKKSGISGIGLLLLFILFVVVVDVVMSATSSKWSIFAPFVLPIFTQFGWHPALITAAFRVADSATNIASPVSPFLYMLIDIAKDSFKIEDCNVGKWLACLIPSALVILVVWTVMLLVWIALNLPLGPGAGVYI